MSARMKVLLAADGSGCVRAAEQLLIRIGDRDRLDITVMSVIPLFPPPPDDQLDFLRTTTISASHGLRDAGFVVQGMHAQGDPAERILDRLKQDHFDLAVVGGGTHSWLARALLGSVAYSVLHGARCGVLVVHRAPLADDLAPVPVLIATDGSSDARAALGTLVRFADPSACVVDVVAVATATLPVLVGAAVGAEGGSADAGETERQMRLAAGDDAEACAAMLRDHEFVATESVMAGPTATALLERIDYSGADLAVVGARGTGGFRELAVGSVSDRVVRNAPATLVGRHPTFTPFREFIR